MSWNFFYVDMFPCEDSKTVSVCPYPEKRNYLGFVNISPTLVIDTSMERSSWVLHHGNPKIWFFFSNKAEIELCLPSSVTGEVYCFPRRQLIFSFDGRVIYHLEMCFRVATFWSRFRPSVRRSWNESCDFIFVLNFSCYTPV